MFKSKKPEYRIWAAMIQRCTNKNHKRFHRYGGRGISVCKRWEEFDNFFIDMGNRPEGMTLERIDNNGNYDKNNCKWASNLEQANNQERTITVEINGQKKSLNILSRENGINCETVKSRLFKFNWSIEDALSIKPGSRRSKIGNNSKENRKRGEAHHKSKLTEKNVIEIRKLYGSENTVQLGKRFNVSNVLIGLIVKRKIWSHI